MKDSVLGCLAFLTISIPVCIVIYGILFMLGVVYL